MAADEDAAPAADPPRAADPARAGDEIIAAGERLAALGDRPGGSCPDPVNGPMIRHWTQAMGEVDPPDGLAPPAMIQVWSMPGLARRGRVTAADEVMRMLDEAGYRGVVATNCEQTYHRYLRIGEKPRSTIRFGDVTGPKRTALGEGYFVTWYQTWYAGSERVAEMLFRVLKFAPRPRRPRGRVTAPTVSHDTRFYWDGLAGGELRIQRCPECGRLRHPPGPGCPSCNAAMAESDFVLAKGTGTVYSYVVHHHPAIPGREPPFAVALVELAEGVRMVGNVVGCPPEDVRIGMPVELSLQRVDEDLTLAQWRPAERASPPAAEAHASTAPPDGPVLEIPLTRTFVMAGAVATRDYTPVHHDPDVARAQGADDVFLNILTTIALVQRYASLRRPGARLRGIAVRLGASAHAGDTLVLTGRQTGETTLEVRGAVRRSDHVTATVTFEETA